MSKCIFKIEDMNGKVIHINDYVRFDWDLAKKKHPRDYTWGNKDSRNIFQVKGFLYFEPYGNVPCFYTNDEMPHYVDCCEIIENPSEDYSIFIEY